jgi:hypothetical protein
MDTSATLGGKEGEKATNKGLRSVQFGLKVDHEYESAVPPMSDQQYRALKESLKRDGQIMPIIVNEHNVVLDGHHRLRAMSELGIPPYFETKRFKSREEELAFIIRINLQRRQMNPFQRIEAAYKLESIEAKKANERRLKVLRRGKAELPSGKNIPNGERGGRAIDRCAGEAALSSDTYRKGREIIKRGSEALKEQVRSGELSIDKAYRQLATKVAQKEDREGSLQENDSAMTAVGYDGELVMMVNGPEDEELEAHLLTKEQCETIGAIGKRMDRQKFCRIIFDVEGRLVDQEIVKKGSADADYAR